MQNETANVARPATLSDINAWVARVQAEVIDPYYQAKFPRQGAKLSIMPGQKNVRIVTQSVFDGKVSEGRSCWAFVSLETGDVLKSDGWKRPAKHARGNIFAANPLAGVGPNGAEYLR